MIHPGLHTLVRVGGVDAMFSWSVFLVLRDNFETFFLDDHGRYRPRTKCEMSFGIIKESQKYKTDASESISAPKLEFKNLTCDFWLFWEPGPVGFGSKSAMREAWSTGFVFLRPSWVPYLTLRLDRFFLARLISAWKRFKILAVVRFGDSIIPILVGKLILEIVWITMNTSRW